jgi:hypothetical protein
LPAFRKPRPREQRQSLTIAVPKSVAAADLKTVLAKTARHDVGQGSNASYSFDENGEQWLIETDHLEQIIWKCRLRELNDEWCGKSGADAGQGRG